MSSPGDVVRPNDYLFLRLGSGTLKAVECKPNQIIDTGRYGSFHSDQLIGRPYYYTYEIIEKAQDETHPRLRVISPAELNAELNAADASAAESRDVKTDDQNDAGYDLVTEDGRVLMKNNQLIVDDASRQALLHEEIEELKKNSAGKDIVEKILANHTALDEKNAFSKAKYTLRKTRKYMKRFVLLPMEIGYLLEYITEKEPSRIMDLRDEPLALVGSWSNAHYAEPAEAKEEGQQGEERILLVDDAGGLVLAALAERKNILRHSLDPQSTTAITNGNHASYQGASTQEGGVTVEPVAVQLHDHSDFPIPAKSNSITLIHAAAQPNVSLLKYFGYDTNQPDPTHPLHTHLKPLSWLQLLHPEEDPLYHKPDEVEASVLQTMKTNKRSAYYKKVRRWQRISSIIDETRAGGFDALVVASWMDPVSIFKHAIPLLRGGAHVVVYSPTIDSLVKLMDLYSKERRTAYIHQITKYPEQEPDPEDFPLDPRLLLAPTLQTSRIREYQVLPGRTHPLMTSRGGNEGYVFTARRVIPLEGGISARGNFSKKRKEQEMNGNNSTS